MKKQKIVLMTISLLGLALFLTMLFLVMSKSQWLATRDNGTALKMTSVRNDFYNVMFVIISYLGETKTILAILVALLILPNRKKIGFPLLVVTLESLILSIIFKSYVARQRPVGYFLENTVLGYNFPHGYSFPSGHSQTANVFWLCLSILCSVNLIKNKFVGDLIVANITIFCFLMCFARVYLCVHFLSDVLAGIGLAIFVVGTNVLLYQMIQNKTNNYAMNKYKFWNKFCTSKNFNPHLYTPKNVTILTYTQKVIHFYTQTYL